MDVVAAQPPDSMRRLAQACLDCSRVTGADSLAALQVASCLLTATVASQLDSGRAHALATLALTLAKRECAALAPVRAAADGSLPGICAALSAVSEVEAERVSAMILATYLHLLGTLIGAHTVARIVAETWPSAPRV